MEFVWRPFYEHLGERVQIFSHVMYNDYRAPKGFDWDVNGQDDPFITDQTLTTFNADNKTATLHAINRSRSALYVLW